MWRNLASAGPLNNQGLVSGGTYTKGAPQKAGVPHGRAWL